jgi:hypothetical protein
MKDLAQRTGVNLAIRTKLHQRFHALCPFVVDLGTPQLVPGLFVLNLGVEEKLQVVLERGDLGNPTILDFSDELRPDVVVIMLILGERFRL